MSWWPIRLTCSWWALWTPAIWPCGSSIRPLCLTPTAADLAPRGYLGRYMALVSFSWQLGLAIGPGVGGFLLQESSPTLWALSASLCLCGGVGALLLESRLPRRIRSTPRSPLVQKPPPPETKAARVE